MKKHPDYRQAMLRSTYFDPSGRESAASVNERWGHPVKQPTLYRHFQRHQKKDIEVAEELARINKLPGVWQRQAGERGVKVQKKVEELENTLKVVEAPTGSNQEHELGLDEFIAMGRAKLRAQDMTISAQNYLTAIKIKAEIEKSSKDRKLDMLKSMFAGAAPKDEE